MSERMSVLRSLAMKIGALPGLGFLQDYVHNADAAKKGFDMKVGDKKNQVSHIKEIGGDMKKVVSKDSKGSKK